MSEMIISKPIRVLCLFTILDRGGAETMCMNLYRNFDRSKVQFDFLVYHQEKGAFEEEILSLGGRVFRIPHIKYLALHIKKARDFFRDHKEYSVVHNHMQSNGCFICREANKAGVKTIIYHSHSASVPIFTESVNLTLRRTVDECLNRVTLYNSTCFFACGEEAAKALPDGKQVTIIRNAIDIEQFKYNPKKRDRVRMDFNCQNKLIIGHVGRFDKNKNQAFAVDVLKKILETRGDAELWLIGDGNLKKIVRDRGDKYMIADKVRLLGVRTDVNDLLQAMDVFIFPSIAEGLPVACIEAQAAGLQCVFSDGFDPHTVVTDNCRTLSLDDPLETWAETVIEMGQLERKDTSEVIRRAGYDIRDTSRIMEEFYLSRAER